LAGRLSRPATRPGRPCDLDALRSLRDQCQAAGTAFWLKQLVLGRKVRELPELDGRTWTERPGAAP
jgi:protein gp37